MVAHAKFEQSIQQWNWLTQVTPDLVRLQTVMVNSYLHGPLGSPDWVLIDAGLAKFEKRFLAAAEQRFGPYPPRAIILTHGHFDHVGNLRALVERWGTMVWAHELELPYLTGQRDYPPGDPSVGGGLMARMAPLYPRRAIDLGTYIRPLPADGSVPHMPGWRWLHTPGHTPGHISLWHEADRHLIAGDAFITQDQESLLGVITEREQIHGPPKYFTTDWSAAHRSVQSLASLEPDLAATGHGVPMSGQRLHDALYHLARRFTDIAVPRHGRYVHEPHARPPRHAESSSFLAGRLPKFLAGGAIAAIAARVLSRRR